MPQSKKRKSQKHHHIDYIPHAKKKKSAIPVAMVFCGLVGLGVAWFAARESVPALAVGLLVGIATGYFAGKQMDRSFGQKG